MNNNTFSIFLRIIFNRDGLLSFVVPMFLYIGAYNWYGLVQAILVSALYGIVISIILKDLGYIALAFALVGLVELLIITFAPSDWLIEALYYKLMIGAMQTCLVFIAFALCNRPLPKYFAEAATPSLKEGELCKTPYYNRVWHEISLLWIVT